MIGVASGVAFLGETITPLAVLGGALVFGCQVEIHCLACRWAAVSTVLSAPADAPAVVVLVELGSVARSQVLRLAPVARDATSQRGPPTL